MKISSKMKIIPILLLAIIVIIVFTLFFFTRIDTIVHSELYKYYLQFDLEWASQYWAYSRLLTGSLTIIILLTGTSVAVLIFHIRTRSTTLRFALYLFLVMEMALTFFSVFLLNRLDYIINNDLYLYGLQFSPEWATPYQTYIWVSFALFGLAGAITLANILILSSTQKRVYWTKLTFPSLIGTGSMSIIFSIILTSTILAFIGLGLVFWGIILSYIRSEEYAKKVLLNTTVFPLLTILNQIMDELDYRGAFAFYLPPRFFKSLEANKAYISKQKELPTIEQIQRQETQFFTKDPQGILVTPPGAGLTKLFEKTLETNFTKVDIQYLQKNMSKLFTEDLEIAQNFGMNIKDNTIQVKIENSTYDVLSQEITKLSNVYSTLGCPLSSAIASSIAKATGHPVMIASYQTSDDGKKVEIEYHILKEEKIRS